MTDLNDLIGKKSSRFECLISELSELTYLSAEISLALHKNF